MKEEDGSTESRPTWTRFHLPSTSSTNSMRTLNFKPRTLNSRWAVVALALITCALSSGNGTAQIQQAWVARYNNGITAGTNQAVKMALDSAGNIYVAGFSQNASSNFGYVTIKYAPNGNQLWAHEVRFNQFPIRHTRGTCSGRQQQRRRHGKRFDRKV